MRKPILAAGIAALFVLSLSSCEINFVPIPGENAESRLPDHTHSYTEERMEPTCTADGYVTYTCTECGYSYTETLSALGHEKTNAVVTPATCQSDGYTTYVCDRCGMEYKSDFTQITGHVAGVPVYENVVAATCTATGSYDYVTCCKYCGLELSRETIITEALGHDYDYNYGTIEPTCTSEGFSTGGVCTRCGAMTGIGSIPALGHDFHDSTSSEVLDNGCTREVYQCSRCDQKAYAFKNVDYTSCYDYKEFSFNSLYSSHRSVYQDMYKTLYDACCEVAQSDQDYSCEESKSYVSIAEYNYAEKGLTQKEAGNVILSFIMNNPQFYFIRVSTYYSSATKVIMIMDPDCYLASAREAYDEAITSAVVDFTGGLDTDLTDLEKAKAIHDYIIDTINYQYDSNGDPSTENWAHSILGVLDGNSATGGVCECYTKTYQYLCDLLGLTTISVAGMSTSGGSSGGHAWNYSKINGSWYGVDATWDDQTHTIYTYFMASKSTMDTEHTPGSSDITVSEGYFQAALPTLSDTAGY